MLSVSRTTEYPILPSGIMLIHHHTVTHIHASDLPSNHRPLLLGSNSWSPAFLKGNTLPLNTHKHTCFRYSWHLGPHQFKSDISINLFHILTKSPLLLLALVFQEELLLRCHALHGGQPVCWQMRSCGGSEAADEKRINGTRAI